jgi:hypothetical protein
LSCVKEFLGIFDGFAYSFVASFFQEFDAFFQQSFSFGRIDSKPLEAFYCRLRDEKQSRRKTMLLGRTAEILQARTWYLI